MMEGEQETLGLNLTDTVQALLHARNPAGAVQQQGPDQLQQARLASALATQLTDQLVNTPSLTAHASQHSRNQPTTHPTKLITSAELLMQVAVDRLSGKESAAEALEALTSCAHSVAQGLHAAAKHWHHTLDPQSSSPTPTPSSEPHAPRTASHSHARSKTPAAATSPTTSQPIHAAVWRCASISLGHKGISTACHLSQHSQLPTWQDTQLETIHACMTCLSASPHALPHATLPPGTAAGAHQVSQSGAHQVTQSPEPRPPSIAHLAMELWLCYKGVVGLRNPNPAVRSSAARVLADIIVLAEQQQQQQQQQQKQQKQQEQQEQQQLGAQNSHYLPPESASPLHRTTPSLSPKEPEPAVGPRVDVRALCPPGLPTIALLQTLLCGLGLKDKDGGVRASAVSAAAPLLARTFMLLSPTHFCVPTLAAAVAAAKIAQSEAQTATAASSQAQTAAATAPEPARTAAAKASKASSSGCAQECDARTKAAAAARKNQAVALLSALLAALTDSHQPVRNAAANALALCPSSMLYAPRTRTVPLTNHAPLYIGNVRVPSHATHMYTSAAHHHSSIALHAPPSPTTSHHTADCSTSSSTATPAAGSAAPASASPPADAGVCSTSTSSTMNIHSSHFQPNGTTGSITCTSSTSWTASSACSVTPASCTSGSPSSGSTLCVSPTVPRTDSRAGTELCWPTMDPRHPLLSWLLHCFASAPLHPRGPLYAFKEPGVMVKAITALLQGFSDTNQHQRQKPDTSSTPMPQEHSTTTAPVVTQLGNAASAAAAAATAASDESFRGMLRALPVGSLVVAGVAFSTHAAWAMQQQRNKLHKLHKGAGAKKGVGAHGLDAGSSWREGRAELDEKEILGSPDGSTDVDVEEEEEAEDMPHGAIEVMDTLPAFWEALGRVRRSDGSSWRALSLEHDGAQASHAPPVVQHCEGVAQPLSPPQPQAQQQQQQQNRQQQLQQQQQQQKHSTTCQPAQPNSTSSSCSSGSRHSGPGASAAAAAISEQALDALEACVGVLVAASPAAGGHPWSPPPEASISSSSSSTSGSDTSTRHSQSAVGGAVAWCNFPAAAAATAQLACHALPLNTSSASAESLSSSTSNSTPPNQHHLPTQHASTPQRPNSTSGSAHLLQSNPSHFVYHSTPAQAPWQHTRTVQKLLALSEQLLDVTEAPTAALYTDEFGDIKSPPARLHSADPNSAASQVAKLAGEQQVGAAWVAQTLAHITGAALAGVHFPAHTRAPHSSSRRQHGATNTQNGGASSPSSVATHAAGPHGDPMMGQVGQEEDSYASGQQQHPPEQQASERGPAECAHSVAKSAESAQPERHVLRSGLVVEVVDLSDTRPGSSNSSRDGTPISVGGRMGPQRAGGEKDPRSHQQESVRETAKGDGKWQLQHGSCEEHEQNVHEGPGSVQQKSRNEQQQQQGGETPNGQGKIEQEACEACLEHDVEDKGRAVATRLLLFWATYAPHPDMSTPWVPSLMQQQCHKQHKYQHQHHPQQHQQQLVAPIQNLPQPVPPADPFPLILHALSSALCLTTNAAPSSSLSAASSSSAAAAAERSSAWGSSKRTPSGSSRTGVADVHSRHAWMDTPVWASSITMAAAEVQQQQLLVTAVDMFVPGLRRVVAACPDLLASQDSNGTHAGPTRSTWDRLVAARQAARLALGVRHPYLSRATPVLLAAAVTTVHDPSPAVAIYGMHTLHHLAMEGLSADLRWQSELLFGICGRLVVGCDESVWHVAAPAAVALVLAIEASNDPRSVRCHALLHDLLFEVELGGHKASRRLPFLSPAVLPALLERLGLTVVRHLSRLLPLLLEWLHSYDAPSRAAASRTLCHLITYTWPRMPRHAPLLWQHLVVLVAKEAATTAAAAAPKTASSVSAAAATGQTRAEVEAAGVEVVSDALAAAKAQLMQAPAVNGGPGIAASTSAAAAADADADADAADAAATDDDGCLGRKDSRGDAGRTTVHNAVLVHALHACLLLAQCCSSLHAFRAAVGETEHTLALAGRAAARHAQCSAQHGAQRARQQESPDAKKQGSEGDAGGGWQVPLQGKDAGAEGVALPAQAASRAGLALLVHHVRAIGT